MNDYILTILYLEYIDYVKSNNNVFLTFNSWADKFYGFTLSADNLNTPFYHIIITNHSKKLLFDLKYSQ